MASEVDIASLLREIHQFKSKVQVQVQVPAKRLAGPANVPGWRLWVPAYKR